MNHSSVQALSKFRKNAKILKNLNGPPYDTFFRELDTDSAENTLIKQFRDFLIAAKAEFVELPVTAHDTALKRYFEREPPFGEGKKKSEFPDAFNLIALESWCDEKSCKVYVVSHDSDLKTYCESSKNLLWLERPGEFLELIVLQDETLAPLVAMLVEDHSEEIELAIAGEFSEQLFWLEDQEGEVLEIIVQGVEIRDHSLIEVTRETAVVEVMAAVEFIANIEYDDMDTATYDSEDKVLIPWRKIKQEVERSEIVSATIYLHIDARAPEIFDIDRTEINRGRDWGIGITAIEDDGYPYK